MEGNEVVKIIEEHIKELPEDAQMPALLAISTTAISRFATSTFEWVGAIDAMKMAIYLSDRKENEE